MVLGVCTCFNGNWSLFKSHVYKTSVCTQSSFGLASSPYCMQIKMILTAISSVRREVQKATVVPVQSDWLKCSSSSVPLLRWRRMSIVFGPGSVSSVSVVTRVICAIRKTTGGVASWMRPAPVSRTEGEFRTTMHLTLLVHVGIPWKRGILLYVHQTKTNRASPSCIKDSSKRCKFDSDLTLRKFNKHMQMKKLFHLSKMNLVKFTHGNNYMCTKWLKECHMEII